MIKKHLGFLLPAKDFRILPLIYLQILAMAELLTALREPSLGLIIHSITLIVILINGALENSLRHRRFLLSISLAPLMRILSLSVPFLIGEDLTIWYLVIGILLYIPVVFTMRVTDLNFKRVGVVIRKLPFQLVFGLTGIFFGLLEYFILRPASLVEEFSFSAMLGPALVLVIFTGFLEELIFRGIIQQTSLASYGRFGITFCAILFAILHVGYGSVTDVIFVFVIAIIFGLVVQNTGSLVGVTISHSLTNIGLLLVFPYLIGLPVRIPIPRKIDSPIATATETLVPVSSQAEFGVNGQSSTVSPILGNITETITGSPADSQYPEAVGSPTFEYFGECKKPVGWAAYSVQPGDTLPGISNFFDVSLEELRGANCLGDNALIRVGDMLFVPNFPTGTPPLTQSQVLATLTISTNTNPGLPTPTATLTPADTSAP